MAETVAKLVREKIASIADNAAFTTKQLLSSINRRNAVDQALCKLVFHGLIKRLAAGVFVRVCENLKIPSAVEIVQVKARSFGKRVQSVDVNAGSVLSPHLFYTDGSRGSFKTVHGTIHLKQVTPRKLRWYQPSSSAKIATKFQEPVKNADEVARETMTRPGFSPFCLGQKQHLSQCPHGLRTQKGRKLMVRSNSNPTPKYRRLIIRGQVVILRE